MSNKTLAAYILAATALCMSSCFLFGKKEKADDPNGSFIGIWKLNTVADSSKPPLDVGAAALLMMAKDSTVIQFNTDSTVTMQTSKQAPDTARYYVDTALQLLFVKNQDTKPDTLTFKKIDGNTIQLVEDSIYMTLKRQP